MVKSNRNLIFSAAIIVVIVAAGGVGGYVYYQSHKMPSRANIIIATTTSLYDTGLLDILAVKFESIYPQYDISFISAGTGIAIQYAKNGDASAVLVHETSAEKQFLEEGYGLCRKIIAYNFFVIVGPEEDPAGIKDVTPKEALLKIATAGREGDAVWVSRGDESGTYAKEKSLWKTAGLNVEELEEEQWYLEAGAGMGSTLNLANKKRAYTLADTATYLKYSGVGLIDLIVLVSAGYELLNVYSVIATNPGKGSGVEFEGAIDFVKFLVSDDGQAILSEFGVDEFGQPLFMPAVELLKEESDSEVGQWIIKYAYIDGSECPSAYWDDHPELYQ
ncbi:MAG: substrate-binding domain-containing protein [Candidatus Bathyarchaeia archaeon]